MRKFLVSVFLAVAMFSLAACENWQRTDVRPVEGKVVGKRTRKPSKGSRRYYVTVEYAGRQVEIRSRSDYDSKNVGDPYRVCLITYVEQETKKTSVSLESCPTSPN